MTSYELKSRIQKANEKIQKKTATITKKETWIASGKKDEYEIKWLQEDISRLTREIAETQKTVEKYEKQLAGELERERVLLTEIPESMKQMQIELVERWNGYDFERRANLKAQYDELGYKEFMKKNKHTGYEFMRLSNLEIIENNEKSAKALIIDLFYRIRHITGEVTDWTGIRFSGGALNGIVTGKEGRAKVESILAGGYNIQRLHVRVLVHSV
jgi:DNA repair exonuclease SbcCD ATPase subunit